MRRTVSLLAAVAMLLPGPSWAQQVVGTVINAGRGVPVVPPAISAPSLSTLSPAQGSLGLTPALGPSALPSLVTPKSAPAAAQSAPAAVSVSQAAPAAASVSQASPVQPLPGAVSRSVAVSKSAQFSSGQLALPAPAIENLKALPKSAPAAASVSQASPLPSSPNSVSGSVEVQGRRLDAQAGALNGEAEAGRAMPSLSHLGAEVQTPKADAGMAEARALAEDAFEKKANFAASIQSSDGVEVEAAGSDSFGRARGKKPVLDEAALSATKYPARDIRFNGKTFPSAAFRPDRPVEAQIVQAIDASKKSILIAAYEFKSKPILKALREARKRGVKIQLVVDYHSAYPSARPDSDYQPRRSMELQSLINEGFDLLVLRGMGATGIMHNKFMVFDGKMAEFGSFNYSYTAEDNHFENVKFTDDSRHIGAFQRYFAYLRSAAVPFADAKKHAWPKEMPPPTADSKPSVKHNGKLFPVWAFSPGNDSEGLIIRAIDSAKESISISMFTLRSTLIAEALLAAKKRGVAVRVILDKSQYEGEYVKPYGLWLAFHRIPVRILAGPNEDGPEYAEKDHNKFMVVDEALVETGSMNWTKSGALLSFENIHFTKDKVDARAYTAYFDDMFRRAEALPAPAAVEPLPTDEQLLEWIRQDPAPEPPPIQWPQMPQAPPVGFNGQEFPAYAFRPQESIQAQLVRAIDAAQKTIHLALYEFRLPEVLDALRRAKKRGVKVHVILDYSHVFPRGLDHTGNPRVRSDEIAALIDEGFDVRVLDGLGSQGIMHNKFAVFDSKLAEFGSFNWAETAENDHFESVNFTAETGRVDFYLRYWAYMHGYAVEASKADGHPLGSQKELPAPPSDESARIRFNGLDLPLSMGSPGGGIEDVLVAAIQAAKTSVDFAMFSFYSTRIAEALLAAHERGIKVRVVLDAGQGKLSKLQPWLVWHGVDVKLLAGPDADGNTMFQKMHNKFMILDGQVLETGSFNHTSNAELRNFENVNFFDLAGIVRGFTAYFEMLYEHGWKPFKPRKEPALKKPEPAAAEA